MTTSKSTKDQIKKWEGLRLFAYRDKRGIPTIGYGHTKGVQMGDAITPNTANALFEEDIAVFEKEINSLGVDFSQNEFDALVSFVYNIGIAKFRKSTMYRYIREGMAKCYIANEFDRWVHCNGEILQGLVKRRRWEKKSFLD